MSATETLREEVQHYIQNADADFLREVKVMYEARKSEASDWWDDTPEEIRRQLTEASKRPIGEGGMTWEEVKARTRLWLHE